MRLISNNKDNIIVHRMMMMLCMLCVMLSCEAAHRHHEGSARELTLSSCRNIVAGRLLFVLVLRTRKKLQFLLQFLRYKLQFRIVPRGVLGPLPTPPWLPH